MRIFDKSSVMLSALVVATAAGCSGVDEAQESLGQAEEAIVVTNCAQPTPSNGVPINFDRELVIRDLAVVEDDCRTTWKPTCSTALRGKWTFGWMMANMAGTSDVTSPTAKQFVANWLKLWLSSQQPNVSKDAVAPRTAITEALIDPWLKASGCAVGATLDTCLPDLTLAPFRLLAFVNRIDLPTIPGYSTGDGEFRVVFGAVGFDTINSVPGATLPATVIFEYNFPNTKTLVKWATLLHGLSSPGSDNSSLQIITDAIVGPNAASGSPNNSPISHVRTNEIAFDCQMGSPSTSCGGQPPDPSLAQWEMRQFKLNGTLFQTGRPLVQEAVSQTPQSKDNQTPELKTQLLKNLNPIFSGDPAFSTSDSALLGNASQSPSGIGAIIWEKSVLTALNTNNMLSADRALTRHQFGFGTCNGCHYAETANGNGVFHVAPRDAGTISSISNFLSAAGAGNPLATSNNSSPTNTQTVADPAGTQQSFKYNEPWRRACEIRRILSGATSPYTKPTGHLL